MIQKPSTNEEALELVLSITGTKTALATKLGVAKQLVSRWDEIPPRYLEQTAEITQLPVDWVLPQLESDVSALLGRPSALILPDLIRLFISDTKGHPWPAPKRTPKKSKKTKRT